MGISKFEGKYMMHKYKQRHICTCNHDIKPRVDNKTMKRQRQVRFTIQTIVLIMENWKVKNKDILTDQG